MGSICSAVIVCRVFNLPNPITEGSKNPGATNVLRIAGKKYAALVLVVDLLKGTLPVVLAKVLGVPPVVTSLTVLAAVLGHMYPVFFDFKGGKGVATAIGALLGFQFIVGIMVASTWLIVVKVFRYSSLASIIAIALSPFYALAVTKDVSIFPALTIVAILILFKHGKNINRLIDGNEPKVFIKENVINELMANAESPNFRAANEEMDEVPVPAESKITPIKAQPIEEAPKVKRTRRPKTQTAEPAKKTTSSTTDKAKPKAKPKAPKKKE
jgi:glycerol-3-phosphate acyltransferase PlsY